MQISQMIFPQDSKPGEIQKLYAEYTGNIIGKNGELAKAHWPDENERKDFYARYSRYFTGLHSDYIYQNVPELMK